MSQDAPTFYPGLFYRDAQAAIDWLERAFGFRRMVAYPGPDGTIAHAEMSFGSGVIMLGTAKADQGLLSPRDLNGTSQGVYAFVEDVDAHYARAKAAGAEITRDLADTDHGSREYSAKDPEGHHWHFGTYRPAS
ncbi:MAG TPA: VOC family protein [Alphaproteobacteria bacterium]|nr:VOC family protein [Alphaproteobacteria bacterium]